MLLTAKARHNVKSVDNGLGLMKAIARAIRAYLRRIPASLVGSSMMTTLFLKKQTMGDTPDSSIH
jgi:hypothetical protein